MLNLTQKSTSTILLATILIFLFTLIGMSIFNSTDSPDYSKSSDLLKDTHYLVVWDRILFHQISIKINQNTAIFTFFIVYLGGRRNKKYFNDRSLETIEFLIEIIFKTALFRAVFIFMIHKMVNSCLFSHYFATNSLDRRNNQ